MNELDVFSQALDLTDPSARQNFLDQACGGQPELRQRIEDLIRNAAQASQFLENPPSAIGPTVDQPSSEAIGTKIGPYKLLQQIGEGGMGTVFMAEQTQPVQRRVALKIIKAGMDSKQVIARFEAERQALAMMDHPNIAKVLDAGATENGRPYFVMELVKGIPITKYCDEKKFGVRERLELFLPACHAVQHAHQKGIIHRDIKPSNVLVALYDGRPVPKIIDFGVAKATASKLTEKTMFTEYGQIIGTLEYMSPEQAELNQLDIDTRTDIYSLGVLLYELLTGTTPIDRSRLKSAAFVELLRIIREEEPPKPSTRLSTCETLASIAANRSAEPSKLSGAVRGDLDWIVMKALDKERSRRYENSTALAQDIERFLNQEAVLARPHSIAYKARKFVHRNRAAVFSATAIAAALLIGTIASSTMAIQFWLQQQQTAAALQQLNQEQQRTLEANQAVSQLAQRESQAKEDERKQRELADQRAQEAESARLAAEQERDKSNRLNDELTEQKEAQRRTAYVAQLNLIQKAWDSNNIARIRELLNATRPGPDESDLRGAEWHFWQRRIHPEENAIAFPEALIDKDVSLTKTRFSADTNWLVVVRDATTEVPRIAIVDTHSGNMVYEKTLQVGSRPFVEEKDSDQGEWRLFTTPVYIDDSRVAVEIKYFLSGGPLRVNDRVPDAFSKLMVIERSSGEIVFEVISRKSPNVRWQSPFAFSGDGKRVAARMEEPFVQVLDMETGQELHKVPILNELDSPRVAEAIALDHQGRRLAIRSLQRTNADQEEQPRVIRIVDLTTGSEIVTPTAAATRIEFSPDNARLFVFPIAGRLVRDYNRLDDTHVAVFDAASGERTGLFSVITTTNGNQEAFQTGPVGLDPVVLSPDGKWLALKKWTGGRVGIDIEPRSQWIDIVDSTNGQLKTTVKGFSGRIVGLILNRDSNSLITVFEQGIVTWPLFELSDHASIVAEEDSDWAAPVSSPDGRWLALSRLQNKPLAASIEIGKTVMHRHVLLQDRRGINGNRVLPVQDSVHGVSTFEWLKFSDNGSILASASVNPRADLQQAAELKLWDADSGRELLSLKASARRGSPDFNRGDELPVISNVVHQHLAISSNSRRIAVAVPIDGTDMSSGTTSVDKEYPLLSGAMSSFATVNLWDVASAANLRTLDPPIVIPWRSRLEFDRDDQHLLVLPFRVTSEDAKAEKFTAQCYDAQTGRSVWQKSAIGFACKTSDDKSMILSIVEDQQGFFLVGWRTNDGRESLRIPWSNDQGFSRGCFSQDQRVLVVASGYKAHVIDPVAGKVLRVLSHPEGDVLELALSADGRRTITSFGDVALIRSKSFAGSRNLWPKGVMFWDTQTGMDLLTLTIPPRSQPELNRTYALKFSECSIRIGHELEFNVEPLSDNTVARELLQAARSIVFSAAPSTAEQERAITFLEDVLRLSPGNLEAASLLAIMRVRIGDAREALPPVLSREGQNFRSEDTHSSEFFTLLALAQHYAGERDKALESIKQAHISASRDEPLWLKLVTEAKRELTIPDAQDVPDEWLGHKVMPRQDDRRFPTLLLRVVEVQGDRLGFGDYYLNSSEVVRLQDAVAYCTSVIQSTSKSRSPTAKLTSAEWWNFRGIVRKELGEFDRAIKDYSEAIELSKDPAYLDNRGILLAEEKEQYGLALADFRKAIAMDPRDEAHASMAMVLRWKGELDNAMTSANEAIRLRSDQGSLYCTRAYIYAALGELDLMRADLDQAAQRSPDDWMVWRERAWLQATSPDAAHRNGQQAVQDATKACELTHLMDEEALDCLAAAYAEFGNFAAAIQQQEKAIALCPVGRRPKFEARLELYKQSKPFREPLIKVPPSGSGM